jgi:hypothetical protein
MNTTGCPIIAGRSGLRGLMGLRVPGLFLMVVPEPRSIFQTFLIYPVAKAPDAPLQPKHGCLCDKSCWLIALPCSQQISRSGFQPGRGG